MEREAILSELEVFERQASFAGRLLNKGSSCDVNELFFNWSKNCFVQKCRNIS